MKTRRLTTLIRSNFSCRAALLLLLTLLGAPAYPEETFPFPSELQADVNFWISIFARYDSDEGALHDNRHLDVVYERVDMPANLSRRERNRRVGKRRDALTVVLRSLASGKRDNLSAEEARVLALWPADVDDATLKAAAGRIRYQQGLLDRFRQGLSRAGRWRDFIEAELTAVGVPLELAALPHVESSYNPDARSHVGASGIWQFTRSTARRYMRVDHVIDERNDPFEATRGAVRLLAYNYSITGNWPMAITAYNHGLAGVRRAMRRHGDTAYLDILRNYNGRAFGFASRNFYVTFLAAKEIDQNPDVYFPGIVRDTPTVYAEAKLADYVSASALAQALGVTQAQIKKHNPALQPTVWQGSKHLPRGFKVRIPGTLINGRIDELVAGVAAISWHNEQLPDLFHTIARGETLSVIAHRYGTRASTLVLLNGLSSQHRIRAGRRLRLPAAGPPPVAGKPATATAPEPVVVAIAANPELEDPEVEEHDPVALVGDVTSNLVGTLQTALLSDPSDYSVAEDNTIEIQPLETLGHYANWLGIRTQRLHDSNGRAFRTSVEVGQRITLEFKDVDVQRFEVLREAYHRTQQDSFFRKNVITGVTEHAIRSGESIWILSLRQYDVPLWLFRQYNPGLDLHKVAPGVTVRFPTMAATNF